MAGIPSSLRPRAPRATGFVFRDRIVTIVAWFMLAACIAGSLTLALVERSSVRSDDQRAFAIASANVSASMASALRRDTDFVATMGSMLAVTPQMTNAQFVQWIASTHAMTRYPGGIGYAYIAFVPASRVAAFGALLLSDPPSGTIPTRAFAPYPAGSRAFYCFDRLTSAGKGQSLPLGLDSCAAGIPGVISQSPRAVLMSARDTGQITTSVLDARRGLFGLASPVYRGGLTPPTVAGRRASLLGWAGSTISGAAILATGGGVKPGLRIEISHRNPGGAVVVVAAAGRARAGSHARTTPVNAHGSWSVSVAGAVTSRLSATEQFWIILIVGLGFSGLLFAFVRVLARSRGAALELVDRKTAELRHLALHDALTGLPNRALILDRVEQGLTRARRYNGQIAVMFLDLDQFKDVNDTFGHAIGDELLCAVSARLQGILRESDTVGRLGGDEFVVLAEGDSLNAGPEVIADRIREVLTPPFALGQDDEVRVEIRTSIGIATGLRSRADELLRDADIALYEAKDAGRGRFVLFAPEMQTEIERRLQLESDLGDALEHDELFLVYQPTFDLASNTMNGVEALLRWRHPTRGVVMPDDFIPAAETTGLIVPIGRWVLHEACRQGTEWQRHDHPLRIFVNVSGRQLEADVDIESHVRSALQLSGLPPSELTLEITETVLMRDAGASARHLTALKALGIRIAIDDFGTGYSSLAYLRQFPVDALKIDRTFITGIAGNPEAGALIHTLVQLGKNLGIETLGEGIEETSELDRLQREACDSGQGYLFARPLPADAIGRLLDAKAGEVSAVISSGDNEPTHV